MAKRTHSIDLSHCKRLIKKRRYRDALFAFDRRLDKLITRNKSSQLAGVARELKTLVTIIDANFRESYLEEPESKRQPGQLLRSSFCGKEPEEISSRLVSRLTPSKRNSNEWSAPKMASPTRCSSSPVLLPGVISGVRRWQRAVWICALWKFSSVEQRIA